MHLDFQKLSSEEEKFKKITYRIIGDSCILKWEWPVSINFAARYKSENYYIDSYKNIKGSNIKIITRGEFFNINNSEFKDHISEFKDHILEESGSIYFIVFPGIIKSGKLVFFKQNDNGNSLLIKFPISYSIIYKKVIQRNKKLIDIIIETEFYLKKDSLRYVVKSNRPPKKLEDGLIFPFSKNFIKGINKFEDIKIYKDEYVDVFFSVEHENNNFILKRKWLF